ncbi:MAG: hypothetical protein II852_05615 [Bacteroidales bacterium]|nr:hypothetical protein [Bacteroidales bacterium]
MNDDYSDIINLPHHVSTRHPQMSMEARAAQFAPFSALTGFEDAIDDTARQQIDEQMLLDMYKEISNSTSLMTKNYIGLVV